MSAVWVQAPVPAPKSSVLDVASSDNVVLSTESLAHSMLQPGEQADRLSLTISTCLGPKK